MGCWGWVGWGALRRQEVRVERGRKETGGDYEGKGSRDWVQAVKPGQEHHVNGPEGSQAGQVRGAGNNSQGLWWEPDSRGLIASVWRARLSSCAADFLKCLPGDGLGG